MSSFSHPTRPPLSTEPLARLFLRFLRFGILAWGGPVAQIAMIRQELVEEEAWISRDRFNRVLAVYQALPGPEAHELCVYFGMIARGRLGGLLGGLGFMLPGFILMFALSWFYVTHGINSPLFAAALTGFQAAVAALIVRAVHRIGAHALTDPFLWAIAGGAGVAHLMGLPFVISLGLAGITYALIKRRGSNGAGPVTSATFLPMLRAIPIALPSVATLFLAGLRSGLFTFGGAYTVIPFLHQDAVINGGWMTNDQFLDGLALSSILPAPLIIFATFVGYLGGGPVGGLALTAGIFLPAFGFTLLGHQYLEKLVDSPRARAFLGGLTAGVVGLISATAILLIRDAITSLVAFGIFLASLLILYRSKARIAVAVVVLGAGLLGVLLFPL